MARILVVDDDDLIRKLVYKTLARAGYEVVASSNGEEAASIYHQEPAALIITDLFMPEQEGMEIIMELRRDYPDVKIIAISGAGALGGHGVPRDGQDDRRFAHPRQAFRATEATLDGTGAARRVGGGEDSEVWT